MFFYTGVYGNFLNFGLLYIDLSDDLGAAIHIDFNIAGLEHGRVKTLEFGKNHFDVPHQFVGINAFEAIDPYKIDPTV